MQPFTVTFEISRQDYIKVLFKRSYKQPLTIIAVLIGVLMLVVAILGELDIMPMEESAKPPIAQFIFGIVALSFPFLSKLQAGKAYDNSPTLHAPIQYTFADEGILCTGPGFSYNFAWNTIVRKEVVGEYLLLFTGKAVAQIVKTSAFTPEQLAFVKSKQVKG